jgi:DNA-binding transcriptional regulator YdaS (Cro superfamily)
VSEASKRGRTARRKGISFERDLVHQLREIFGDSPEIKRNIQPRGGRPDAAPDVECPELWVEAKSTKSPHLVQGIRQASAETDGRIPVCVNKITNEDTYAVLRWDDLRTILRDWVELRSREGALLRAVRVCGGVAQTANRLNVSESTVYRWIQGSTAGRTVPIEQALEIETVTEGQVRAEDLRTELRRVR